MTPFVQGVIAGAGGVVVLIGLLITIPMKLHALAMAAQLRDKGLE
ncbi:hypothetical protein [Gluconacetobacter entanii]|nr:hypothetical protein [Gluconacetobacter entanii]